MSPFKLVAFTLLLCTCASGQSISATLCISKLISGRSDVAVAYDGNDSIYILGGTHLTANINLIIYDEVHKFNVTSDTIEVIERLPEKSRDGHAHFRQDVGDILHLKHNGTHLWSFNVSSGVTTNVSEWLGDSYGIGVTYLPEKLIAFGGRNDPHSVYSFDLGTSTQSSSGSLPIPSNFPVSVYSPSDHKTYLFGGEIGTPSPTLMVHDHSANSTSILPWTFPYWRLGTGSSVLVPTQDTTFMYVLGTLGQPQDYTNNATRVDLNSGTVEVLPITNLPPKQTSMGTVYVPKLNRIYLIGGYDFNNYDDDSIWFIQL